MELCKYLAYISLIREKAMDNKRKLNPKCKYTMILTIVGLIIGFILGSIAIYSSILFSIGMLIDLLRSIKERKYLSKKKFR